MVWVLMGLCEIIMTQGSSGSSMAKRKKKSLWNKAKKMVGNMGKDLYKSPLGRASRGKHTKGYL